MVHVFSTMGTVVSLRIDDDAVDGDVLTDVEARFAAFDDEFSRYRPDSPATRIADGRLSLARASAEHKHWYGEAVQWRNATGGAFDPHRLDGTVDLAGIVKAAALEAAGAVLDAAGVERWCCNAGGDVLTAGGAPATPWTVGITHPDDAARLLTTIALDGHRRAVATSGTSQRGEHVWRTDTAGEYRQVTVVGNDVVTADVLATAVLAGGHPTLLQAVDRWGVDVVAVTSTGDLVEATRSTTVPHRPGSGPHRTHRWPTGPLPFNGGDARPPADTSRSGATTSRAPFTGHSIPKPGASARQRDCAAGLPRRRLHPEEFSS